jgi:TolB-like protein
MSEKPVRFEKFFKELKRRKVVHVITVYLAVAFVILQLVDIIVQPLRLPDWTTALVIVLLGIGFIIAVFYSWVYDLTPAGVTKTRPMNPGRRTSQIPAPASNGWKIATYVSAAMIVALLLFNFFGKRNRSTEITKFEKSIAVLPFRNDSSSDSTTYFINGLMDEILNNLQKIGAFTKVLSRTSTEKYRKTDKTVPEIAKELGVNFLVEGSGQKYGNFLRTRVQLIDAKTDKHLWVDSYEKEIKGTKDIFDIQSQIAQSIASELKVVISPEEKQLIEKKPTVSMAAWELYLKANNYLDEYEQTRDLGAYRNGVAFYMAALSVDSSLARAYTGLANMYFSASYRGESFFNKNYLDTILILTDKALAIDKKLDESYYLKGLYFEETGDFDRALQYYDTAININPNYFKAYKRKGVVLSWYSTDFVKNIDNLNTALKLCGIDERPSILKALADVYQNIDFPEKAKKLIDEAYQLDHDTADYQSAIGWLEFYRENIDKGLDIFRKIPKPGPYVVQTLIMFGRKEEAYLLASKVAEDFARSGQPNLVFSHRIGYAFYNEGKTDEANYYFEQQIKLGEKSIRDWTVLAKTYSAQYDLAATYAFLGEKDKAYKYLDEFVKTKTLLKFMIIALKYDPLFDKIRNEQRFQRIIQQIETKFMAEHDRVKKWLEQSGMS